MSVNFIRCVSYNCRGWNTGSLAVRDFIDSYDLCFIQEHWLLHEHLSQLNIDSNFLYSGVSGMDSTKWLHGRPFGGCAILYRKSLAANIFMLKSVSK